MMIDKPKETAPAKMMKRMKPFLPPNRHINIRASGRII